MYSRDLLHALLTHEHKSELTEWVRHDETPCAITILRWTDVIPSAFKRYTAINPETAQPIAHADTLPALGKDLKKLGLQ